MMSFYNVLSFNMNLIAVIRFIHTLLVFLITDPYQHWLFKSYTLQTDLYQHWLFKYHTLQTDSYQFWPFKSHVFKCPVLVYYVVFKWHDSCITVTSQHIVKMNILHLCVIQGCLLISSRVEHIT